MKRLMLFQKGIPLVFISTVFLGTLFQNCSPVAFTNLSSEELNLQTCESNPSLCPVDPVNPESPTCSFNGNTYKEGESITAFLYSSVPAGQFCQSEQRVCKEGSFTGSYSYATCAPGAYRSCLFNGVTLAHGHTVQAYLNSSVAFGSTCQSENRTCNDGVLSGTYAYSSCAPGAAASCLFNGRTIPHGSNVTAYPTSSVAFGQTCQPQIRTCNNGTLSGSAQFEGCTPGAAASCLFNGSTVPHGGSVTAYQTSSVSYGQTCAAQTRSCNNGALSGTYQYSTCSVSSVASCLFNGQTIAHGQSVTAYASASVSFGQSCSSQTRTCNNGSLLGSYQFSSCTAGSAASCSFNGQTIAHGQSVTAYVSPSVPYGQSCSSQTRTCNNGSLLGSNQYSSCSVGSAASCYLNGQMIAHGQGITTYASSSVGYGQSCASQYRVCSNGSLSGSYTASSCTVAPAPTYAPCKDWNGNTIPHGSGGTAYATSSVPYGQSCASEQRICNNGTFTGSYGFPSCTVQPPASCTDWYGNVIPHGSSGTAYAASSVPYGQSCASERRTCNNGTFTGSYGFPSCTVQPPASCSIHVYWGYGNGGRTVTLQHGESYSFYRYSQVRNNSCDTVSGTTTCNNGSVSDNGPFNSHCDEISTGSPLMIHFNSDLEKIEPLEFSSQIDGIIFDILGRNSKPTPYAPKQISWYKSPQYFFITLPTKDGEVKGIDQLFGDNTQGPDGKFAKDGYKALAKYDGMSADGKKRLHPADGFITAKDPVFKQLRLWNDENYDGIAQSSELQSLENKNIEIIDLNADPNYKETDKYGNETTLKSVVKTKDGRYHLMFDVWFAYKDIK